MTPLLIGVAAVVVVWLWWVPPAPAWTPGANRDGARSRGRTPRMRGARGPATAASSQDELAEALDLLALGLQGGGSLAGVARTVALVLPGPGGEGLARVAEALAGGHDTEQAWAEAGPGWEPARRCLELARVAGVAPGPALRQTAVDLRTAQVADVEVATARLGVRMVLPLGLAFLPAFVLTTVLPLVLALTRDLSW